MPKAPLKDLEGTELPSLDDARREAIADARFLMSQAILDGRDISDQLIEIVSQSDAVLLTVPFREAMRRDG